MFTYKTSVRIHNTDAAGRIFFAEQLKLAHDAYEQFMFENGFRFGELIKNSKYAVPIVHAESDYKAQLFAGDPLEITVQLQDAKNSSFTLFYELMREGKLVGTVTTVHVFIDRASGTPVPIQESYFNVIEKLK